MYCDHSDELPTPANKLKCLISFKQNDKIINASTYQPIHLLNSYTCIK